MVKQEKVEGRGFRQIAVDVAEWEQLGIKVGRSGRSAWIRQAIHEEVKLPSEIPKIRLRLAEINDEKSLLERALEKNISELEKTRKSADETKTNMENAIIMALEFIDERIVQEKAQGDYVRKEPGIYGHDKNNEIAELFDVDPEKLLIELKDQKEFEMMKFSVLPETVDTPGILMPK